MFKPLSPPFLQSRDADCIFLNSSFYKQVRAAENFLWVRRARRAHTRSITAITGGLFHGGASLSWNQEDSPRAWAATRYHILSDKKEAWQMFESIPRYSAKLNFFFPQTRQKYFFFPPHTTDSGWMALAGLIYDHENGVIVIWLTQ